MILLCFDPGLTTGYAVFEEGEFGMLLTECGHCYSLRAVAGLFSKYAAKDENKLWSVAESFARGNSVVNEQIQTIRMCGAIAALSEVYFSVHTEQYPASRTGYVPIAKQMIKELGFGTLQENHHAIDAIAHGLCWMDNHPVEWQKSWWMKQTFN